MVKKKQDNKNNVDETIIEMGPVIKKEPYTKLNILVIIFGISSLPITVLILLWFNFYKIPSFLVAMEILPRSATGKVLKFELRQTIPAKLNQ